MPRGTQTVGSKDWLEVGRFSQVVVQRRIERLLAEEEPAPPVELLRIQRALRVLESAGTPQAKDLLKKFAEQTGDKSLAREAKAALKRLERVPRE